MATVVMPEIGNNGITLLSGAINASVTTVNVDSAAALTLSDSTSDSYITVIDQTTFGKNPFSTPETQEIMRVTGVSTNALTVTRGVDGTSGTAFADNSYVMLRNNAATLQRVYDALTDGNDTLHIAGLTGDVDIGADLDVVGDVDVDGGTLKVGVDGNTNAVVNLYGNNTTSGPKLRMWNANDEDTNYNYFAWEANGDSLKLGTNASSEKFKFGGNGDLQIDGDLEVDGDLTVPTKTPSSASATGTVGTISWDASYIYICVATNTWERAAIASW